MGNVLNKADHPCNPSIKQLHDPGVEAMVSTSVTDGIGKRWWPNMHSKGQHHEPATTHRIAPHRNEPDMVCMMTKTDLPSVGARVVELMQHINFGRIEELVVRGGAPVLDPPPRILREVKFPGENGPRPEVAKADFSLKAQVRELFAQLEALGDGTVRCIEVKHGLPFKMTIEEVIA